MRLKAMLWGTCLVAAATVGMAAPASAAPVCVGTASTVVQCVDPTGATLVDDCVYAGSSSCIPVFVPGPRVYCLGGEIGQDLTVCEN
jgi:hypothetical protein